MRYTLIFAATMAVASTAGAQQEPAPKDTVVRDTTVQQIIIPQEAPRSSADSTSAVKWPTVSAACTCASQPTPTAVAGLYFGEPFQLDFPTGDMSRRYNIGYGSGVAIGWQSPKGPIGVRFNFNYNAWDGKEQIPATPEKVERIDPTFWSYVGSVTYTVPIRKSRRTSAYYFMGLGYHTMERYATHLSPLSNRAADIPNQTAFGIHAGTGLNFGVGKWTNMFLETQWVSIHTGALRATYMPLTLGYRVSLEQLKKNGRVF